MKRSGAFIAVAVLPFLALLALARTTEVTGQQEYTFATMSDGVRIALAIGYPKGFDSHDTQRKWPAIFSICGYPSATQPMNPSAFGERAVTVNASLRGSGASGGALNPWLPRSRQDGYEVIENWIVKQPWSNGKVGIVGHSWPGLMGFLVATTQPPSLKGVFVSGLIDDFYRSIARIGGIRNCGFPEDWLNSFYRLDGPFGSGTAARDARKLDDATYRQIVKDRPPRDLREDLLWISLTEEFDGPHWQDNALHTLAPKIRAPIHIMQTYQDEQTGPNGWWLWKRVPADVPKRLILSNGSHNGLPAAGPAMAAWLQHWLLGEGDGIVTNPATRVRCYFETMSGAMNAPLTAPDFPLPETRWTRYYLQPGNRLATELPAESSGSDSYRITRGEPTDKSAHVQYRLSFTEPVAICGPLVLTLWAQATTLDTDFFALVADQAPDGTLYGLQRGLLRASHRKLDIEGSDYVTAGDQKLLVRPRHPHTQAEPLTPHQPYEFQIEIPAVGHVFRPGHALVLIICQPPPGDPIGVTKNGEPSYRYDSNPPIGTITVLRDRQHSSSLLVPILPKLPPLWPDAPDMRKLAGIQPVVR